MVVCLLWWYSYDIRSLMFLLLFALRLTVALWKWKYSANATQPLNTLNTFKNIFYFISFTISDGCRMSSFGCLCVWVFQCFSLSIQNYWQSVETTDIYWKCQTTFAPCIYIDMIFFRILVCVRPTLKAVLLLDLLCITLVASLYSTFNTTNQRKLFLNQLIIGGWKTRINSQTNKQNNYLKFKYFRPVIVRFCNWFQMKTIRPIIDHMEMVKYYLRIFEFLRIFGNKKIFQYFNHVIS